MEGVKLHKEDHTIKSLIDSTDLICPSLGDVTKSGNEIDWFAFENRIRSTVLQLITPLQLKYDFWFIIFFRLKSDDDRYHSLSCDLDTYKRRLDEVEFLSHKT